MYGGERYFFLLLWMYWLRLQHDYAVGEILFFRALFGFIPIFFFNS